jgi:hypothetical protein
MRKNYAARLLSMAMVPAAMMALVGCGNDSDGPSGTPKVASVSQAPDAKSSAAAPRGPQARLDTTEAEKTAWLRAYSQCLVDNGLVLTAVEQQNMRVKGFVDDRKAPAAARTTCASKKPETVPPQMDPAKNPRYKQQWHDDVECLKRKGMPIEETDDGWTFTSSDAKVPANEQELERQCKIEAFSK